jgi:hypothetical protein
MPSKYWLDGVELLSDVSQEPAAGDDVTVQMIDTSVVRVHQPGSFIADGHQWPA